MLLRSEVAAGAATGWSGGGSAEAALAGGDVTLGLAGDELRLLALGATCSNAEPNPGNAYGAKRWDLDKEGAGGTGGGGKVYCWRRGCKLNRKLGGI